MKRRETLEALPLGNSAGRGVVSLEDIERRRMELFYSRPDVTSGDAKSSTSGEKCLVRRTKRKSWNNVDVAQVLTRLTAAVGLRRDRGGFHLRQTDPNGPRAMRHQLCTSDLVQGTMHLVEGTKTCGRGLHCTKAGGV